MDEINSSSIPQLLNNMGVTTSSGGFNWPNIMAGIVFGTIGMVAFMYGKKEKSVKPLGIGITLMVYPYFFSNTFLIFAIGIVLTGALVFWKD